MLSIGDIADIPPPHVGPQYKIGVTINTTFNHGICKAEIVGITNRVGEYTYDVVLLTDCNSRSGVIPAGTRTWVYIEQITTIS
ncbi:hypothetical protein [Methylococcus sp. EFPC2]|uniref:hypothetical protein n=1 Tax=Methylococcus sp. EFPC2 TaxID=2812648 RepID=UPI001968746B|nr:hypothetical protein [Methylococcus sp. EFPC2]QSA98759.1 hypothetical protein JWZ97_08250 [Methylococcus sp. EFPC2]